MRLLLTARRYHHAVAEVHRLHRAAIDHLVEAAIAAAVVSSTEERAVQWSPDADAHGLVVQAAQDFVAYEEAEEAIQLTKEEDLQVAIRRVLLCHLTVVVAICEETIIRVTLTIRHHRLLRPEDIEEAEAVVP